MIFFQIIFFGQIFTKSKKGLEKCPFLTYSGYSIAYRVCFFEKLKILGLKNISNKNQSKKGVAYSGPSPL